MTLAIVILIALTTWHYLWDGIIAPSLRMELRFRLFALRDKARDLCFDGNISRDWFRYTEDSLNAAIQVLPSLDFTGLCSFWRAVQADPDLRCRVERHVSELESAPTEVKEISSEASQVLYKAFTVNIGAWLLPLAIVNMPILAATRTISRVLALTEKEVGKWFGTRDYETLAFN